MQLNITPNWYSSESIKIIIYFLFLRRVGKDNNAFFFFFKKNKERVWKVFAEPQKTLRFLASRREEFNPVPEMRLDCSEFLCNKVLLKYKRDSESFWYRRQKGAERMSPC